MHFNPRSREGSDLVYYGLLLISCISIHAPAKGATILTQGKEPVDLNFNPRSREGSDSFFKTPFQPFVISIHAPAKGATILFTVFVHSVSFQSTLPRRERPKELITNLATGSISIHAPAKGATKKRMGLMLAG